MCDDDTTKTCTYCKTAKPLTEFYPYHMNRRHPDGLTVWCKECWSWKEKLGDGAYHLPKTKRGRPIAAHRGVMETKLDRALCPGEVVHHIDMDGFNHHPDNLHLYADNSAHGKGHGSVTKLVASLLQRGQIAFVDGKYVLCEDAGEDHNG